MGRRRTDAGPGRVLIDVRASGDGHGSLDAKTLMGLVKTLTGLVKTLTGLIFGGVTIRSYRLNADVHRIGEAFPELLGWAAIGKLKIEADGRFPLADAAEAHKAIAARKTSGRVVLEP